MSTKTTHILISALGLVLFLVFGNGFLLFDEGKELYSFSVGDIAEETIRSPRTVSYKSESLTTQISDASVQDIAPVYKLDQAAYARQQQVATDSISQLFSVLDEVGDVAEKEAKIQLIFNEEVDAQTLLQLGSVNELQRLNIQTEVERIVLELHKKELINADNIDDVAKQIASNTSTNFPVEQKQAIQELAQNVLIPNSIIDKEATAQREQVAREGVDPVYYQIQKDEIIVQKGEQIDELIMERLSAAGLLSPGFALKEQIGTVLLIALLTTMLYFYIQKNIASKRDLKAIVSLVTLSALGFILVSKYFVVDNPILAYVVPVAGISIAIGMLSSIRLGIFSGLFFTILLSFSFGNLFDVLVIHTVLVVAGLLVFNGIERFRSFTKPVVILTLLHFALTVSFHFLAGSITISKAIQLILVSISFSISTAVIVVGILILVGIVFKIATFPVLLDLANPASPLLKELAVKAPGTYHHSIIVGSLAEKAVRDIGGDTLFAKVAAYYHDIGKLNTPKYYIENRKHIPSDKDVADPLKEAQHVMSHVDYGLTLAKKHGLPEEISSVIAEHHGTTAVLYFYNLSDRKSKEDFRYKGPKPQTRESAVIMLADGVEAYVRAYHEKEDFNLSQAVSRIIKERLRDNQLDESGITLREISIIHTSFVEILKSIYHGRIEYE